MNKNIIVADINSLTYASLQDKQYIDSILSAGKYAISHSPDYREAYHPHYRIINKDIFEREHLPLITDRKHKKV